MISSISMFVVSAIDVLMVMVVVATSP